MIAIDDTEVVISWPEVDDTAVLRMHFRTVEIPDKQVQIRPHAEEGIQLATTGRVVLHLRPGIVTQYGAVRYPFAMLVSVGGKNAITGVLSLGVSRTPQNYFVTPPQGGIDGYFAGGQVHPMRVAAEAGANRTRLALTVFPMKRQEFESMKFGMRLIPGPGPKISGITLQHGGERACEPIYEDLCGLGSWDQSRTEKVVFWVKGDGHPY